MKEVGVDEKILFLVVVTLVVHDSNQLPFFMLLTHTITEIGSGQVLFANSY
jgi:hypothetical protein